MDEFASGIAHDNDQSCRRQRMSEFEHEALRKYRGNTHLDAAISNTS